MTAKIAMMMRTKIMTTGMPVEPIFERTKVLSSFGKFATFWSPITTRASPRKRASVPIVTASEGRPRVVIRKPLKAPHTTPTNTDTKITIPMSQPESRQSTPITALVSPAIDATERSISLEMITRAMGMAMRRIGMIWISRNPTVSDEAK